MNDIDVYLTNIPDHLTEKLIGEYVDLKKNHSTGDWVNSQLSGGRFAEVVLRIFQHLLQKPTTPFSDKVKNWESLLNEVENDPNIDSHLRQKATSLVGLLLRFRNNRDSAHVNGFDASRMDTEFVMAAATWVLCELIRLYSSCDMKRAEEIVDDLSVKNYPALISIDGKSYIARHNLTAKEEIMVLLYEDSRGYDSLFAKTKDKNSSRFNEKLSKLKSQKFIAEKDGEYHIMPRGSNYVENEGLLDCEL